MKKLFISFLICTMLIPANLAIATIRGDGTFDNPYVVTSERNFDSVLAHIMAKDHTQSTWGRNAYFFTVPEQFRNNVVPIRHENRNFTFAEIVFRDFYGNVVADGIFLVLTADKRPPEIAGSGVDSYFFEITAPKGYVFGWRGTRTSRRFLYNTGGTAPAFVLNQGVNEIFVFEEDMKVQTEGDIATGDIAIIRNEKEYEFVMNSNAFIRFLIRDVSLSEIENWNLRGIWAYLEASNTQTMIIGCSDHWASIPINLPYGWTVRGLREISISRASIGTTIVIDDVKHFRDATPSDWFYNDVIFVVANGLFGGVCEDRFEPNTAMTRAMMITVLARYADVDTIGGAEWWSQAVEWGVENGITDGEHLTSNVTREQLVTLLWRYENEPSGAGSANGFTDANEISYWAVEAMNWAIGAGLISGFPDNTIQPQSNATRAEVATIFRRLAQ